MSEAEVLLDLLRMTSVIRCTLSTFIAFAIVQTSLGDP